MFESLGWWLHSDLLFEDMLYIAYTFLRTSGPNCANLPSLLCLIMTLHFKLLAGIAVSTSLHFISCNVSVLKLWIQCSMLAAQIMCPIPRLFMVEEFKHLCFSPMLNFHVLHQLWGWLLYINKLIRSNSGQFSASMITSEWTPVAWGCSNIADGVEIMKDYLLLL